MKLQFSARSSSQENYLDPSACGLAVHSSCVRGDGSLSDPFLYEICLENTSQEPFLGVFHTELCAEAFWRESVGIFFIFPHSHP